MRGCNHYTEGKKQRNESCIGNKCQDDSELFWTFVSCSSCAVWLWASAPPPLQTNPEPELPRTSGMLEALYHQCSIWSAGAEASTNWGWVSVPKRFVAAGRRRGEGRVGAELGRGGAECGENQACSQILNSKCEAWHWSPWFCHHGQHNPRLCVVSTQHRCIATTCLVPTWGGSGPPASALKLWSQRYS